MGNPTNFSGGDIRPPSEFPPPPLHDLEGPNPVGEGEDPSEFPGGHAEPRYLMMGMMGALTISSFFSKERELPRWAWDGDTFLAGQGFSQKTWESLSGFGHSGIHGGVLGYYTAQLIHDHERVQERSLGAVSTLLFAQGASRWTQILASRESPDRLENRSFISEDVASSAGLAVYLSADLIHSYGAQYPKLVPALVGSNLLTTLFVATSEVGANKHYFLDVAIGLALGTGCGLLNAHIFFPHDDDGKEEPQSSSGQAGLWGAGLGTLLGFGFQWFRSKLGEKRVEEISLAPQGPDGSPGITLGFSF